MNKKVVSILFVTFFISAVMIVPSGTTASEPSSGFAGKELVWSDGVYFNRGYTTGRSDPVASTWGIRQHGSVVGSNSWDFGDGNYNNWPYGTLSWLISPSITLTDVIFPELTFQHWRDFSYWWINGCGWTEADGGNVKISTNGPDGPWEILHPKGGYDGILDPFHNSINPLRHEPVWWGTEDWTTATFDLNEYVGETIHIRWDVGVDSIYEAQGWRIDDIKITSSVFKDVYFRMHPSYSHTYNYTYNSAPAYEETRFMSGSQTWYVVDNTMSIAVNVQTVSADEFRNTFALYVSSVGIYDIPSDKNWLDPSTMPHYVGTTGINMEGRVVNIEGSVGPVSLSTWKGHAAGNNLTHGSWGGTEPLDPVISDAAKWATLTGAGYTPYLGEAMDFIDETRNLIEGFYHGQKLYDHFFNTGGSGPHPLSGPGMTDGFHWDHPLWGFDYDFEWPDPNYQPLRRSYGSGVIFGLAVDRDSSGNLPDSLTLEFSVNNEIGVYDYGLNDFTRGPVDGAKASVEITIKNSDFDIVNNLQRDKRYHSTSEYSGTGQVRLGVRNLEISNKVGCDDAEYRVDIQYNTPWTSGWHDFGTFWFNQGKISGTTYRWLTIPSDRTSWQKIDIQYKIEALSEYGSWSSGWESHANLFFSVRNNEGGGGGGGGCPYVSVWNGEEYVHDNNILIASEHQPGVVDDNYILQNTMVPKDGYYSLKIEEFEHSQDFFDTLSLYTIDHREGYSVGTTPDYEYTTYKDPVPPISAYDGYGQDVLEYVSDPDSEPMHMPEGSSVVLNYGVMGNARWQHQKLVVRSHGFESYTEPSTLGSAMDTMDGDISPMSIGGLMPPAQKTSLYVSLRVDEGDWVNVTVIHPRNHPSDIVVPLRDVLQQFVPGGIGEVEVQIVSTRNHYLDFVGLDNSVPTPVNVQEAPLVSAMLNGVEDVTDILLEGNGDMVTIIPGEYIILTFEIPRQLPGPVFRVRDFMLFSRGYYHLYEGENTEGGCPVVAPPDEYHQSKKEEPNSHRPLYHIDVKEKFNMERWW